MPTSTRPRIPHRGTRPTGGGGHSGGQTSAGAPGNVESETGASTASTGWSYLIALLVLLLLYLFYGLLAGTWDLWKLAEGADGRPSTSKLQFLLWTVVALFSY